MESGRFLDKVVWCPGAGGSNLCQHLSVYRGGSARRLAHANPVLVLAAAAVLHSIRLLVLVLVLVHAR